MVPTRCLSKVSLRNLLDAASEDTRSHYELSGDFDLVKSVCQTARNGDIILTLSVPGVSARLEERFMIP